MAEGMNTPTSSTSSSPGKSPRRSWTGPERAGSSHSLRLVPLTTPLEEILEWDSNGKLWPSPKELVEKLHIFLPSTRNEKVQEVLVSQYERARKMKKFKWIKEFRACVAIHQDDRWMIKNIGYRPQRQRTPKRSNTQSSTGTASTMCKDVRLLSDPSLPVIVEDAAKVKVEVSEDRLIREVKKEHSSLTSTDPIVISDEENSDRDPIPRSESGRPERLGGAANVHVPTTDRGPIPRSGIGRGSGNIAAEVERRGLFAVWQKSVAAETRHQSVATETLPAREVVQTTPAPGAYPAHQECSRRPREDLRLSLNRKRLSNPSSRDRSSANLQQPRQEEQEPRKVRLKSCPIEVCTSAVRNMRRHVMERHLPRPLQPEQLMEPSLDNKRLELLLFLKCRITGDDSSLADLLAFVNERNQFTSDNFVPRTDFDWLTGICQRQGWHVPVQFKLTPVNSKALLFHWRVLLVLLCQLSSDEQGRFRNGMVSDSNELGADQFQVVDSVGFGEEADVEDIQPCLDAFDSHFHADRLSKALWGHPRAAIVDLVKADVGCSPRNKVNVVGGVMVYCDPDSFPARLPSVKGFGAAIGVHPKKCRQVTPARFQVVLDFLKSWDVVALGETGLDRTEPEETWKVQEETMVKLLRFSMPVRPVILHMRERSDQHAGEVSAKCLQLMKANAAPTQKIHLHSFGGTVEQVVGWLDAFPNCYFGFSSRVSSFDRYQIAALQRVPADRLLLETDAPYFKPVGATASTPAFLGDIGEVVSKHRGTPLLSVMQLTTQNGKDLYSL